jgi:hypothetical protein
MHGRHFDYWNQPVNPCMPVCYLDCHEAGLCCYVVIHIENLLRPFQLFYFNLWHIYWLSSYQQLFQTEICSANDKSANVFLIFIILPVSKREGNFMGTVEKMIVMNWGIIRLASQAGDICYIIENRIAKFLNTNLRKAKIFCIYLHTKLKSSTNSYFMSYTFFFSLFLRKIIINSV